MLSHKANDTILYKLFADLENPYVLSCPQQLKIQLNPGERERPILWKEPEFTDNVGVKYIYKSRVKLLHCTK